MWLLEVLDTLSGHALDRLGLRSWQLDDLWGVFTAPWLHLGWQHLANNSVPLLVLGFLVALAGVRRWVVTALVVVLCSGLAAWLLSPPGTLTLGASGLVFGFLTYLLVRGWWTRDWRQVLVGLVVLVVYGSVLWGVLPTGPSISWQGHLGGAVGGVLAAWLQHGRGPSTR
ncbi:rhomboid family intramembrane serine protease [Luteococcus peritonei]|uniref:Rhomboid family intramembrane serine protease n=1 Tax=Luteococcus peritonei TaxID=88874 RepID=A0ABW4RS01_9ACTN